MRDLDQIESEYIVKTVTLSKMTSTLLKAKRSSYVAISKLWIVQ